MDKNRFSLMTFPFLFDQTIRRVTTKDIFEIAQQSGVSRLDIMDPGPRIVKEHLECMKHSDIRICCYIASISFFESRQKETKDLDRHLAAAEELGAELFMIVPFKAPGGQMRARRLPKDQVQVLMMQGFQLAAERARGRSLTVCFETTPHECFALSGTQDIAWMLEQVPELGLVFDTANMLPHGDETLSAYEALKDRIVHVHLKDVALSAPHRKNPLLQEHTPDGRYMTRALWGEGVIPVNVVYSRLLRDGYDGRFAIEYQYPKNSNRGAEAHVRQVERFFEYLKKTEDRAAEI